jgi:hypothetical protein
MAPKYLSVPGNHLRSNSKYFSKILLQQKILPGQFEVGHIFTPDNPMVVQLNMAPFSFMKIYCVTGVHKPIRIIF